MWYWYDRIEQWLAVMLLSATALTMLASSTMRAIGHPFAGGAELSQLLFIWTTVLGADITLRRGDQVRVDIFTTMMPPWMLRGVIVVCLLLMFAFLGLLIRYGFPLAFSNWQRPLGVGDLSYGYVTLALPAGATLMTLSLLRRLWRQGVMRVFSPDPEEAL